jgi:AcrR family transcriptional regulator
MRAVARAARTNTPAVYRRFKNREDLIRGLLQRTARRLRSHFEEGETLEGMAEAYIDFALDAPHEYELLYTHAELLSRRNGRTDARPIRETRPNFALAEQLLAKRFGGNPEDHTRLALELWALLHGTTMLLLSRWIPDNHREELRNACRIAVKALLRSAPGKRVQKKT